MEWIVPAAQVVIALGLINVWVFRYGKSTEFRPAGADNMEQEFRRYGLPDWMRVAVGAAKLAVAALMIVGLFYANVALPAAAVLALLMVGAVFAHIRVRDPWTKSVPALLMLLLATTVIIGYAA